MYKTYTCKKPHNKFYLYKYIQIQNICIKKLYVSETHMIKFVKRSGKRWTNFGGKIGKNIQVQNFETKI
jgi:hypothetical protein